jgi:hypothetical protein
MANTYVDYTATAGQTDFAFSFPYLEDEHVQVLIDGVETSDFTISLSPATKVVLNTGVTSGQVVRVRRNSDPTVNLVDFVNGSVLTESDLDRAYQHNRYLNEEAFEGNTSSLQVLEGTTNFNANFNKIVNLAPPTASLDAANKDYVDDKLALSGTSLSGFNKSTHTGDGTSDQFNLSFTPQTGTAAAFRVAIDGVLQTPDDAYTVDSGASTITFTSAPPTNAEIVVVATGTAQDVNSIGVTATGSTTARSLADRFDDVVNVKDYGATGDGTTNDTSAVQAAVNTGASAVYFPDGTYFINDVSLPSNIRLFGDATIKGDLGTSVPSGHSYSKKLFTASSQSNIIFDGLKFDGGIVGEIGSTEFTATDPDSLESLLELSSCNKVILKGCEFNNFNGQATATGTRNQRAKKGVVYILDCQNVEIFECKLGNNVYVEGFVVLDSSDIVVRNNYSYQDDDNKRVSSPLAITGADTENVIVADNLFIGHGGSGVNIWGSNNFKITGNTFKGPGIDFSNEGGYSVSQNPRNITINNNSVDLTGWSSYPSSSVGYGVIVQGDVNYNAKGVLISGNHVVSCKISMLADRCIDARLESNRIINPWGTTAGAGLGISTTDSTFVQIQNNFINGEGTTEYGSGVSCIYTQDSTHVTILNNIMQDAASYLLYINEGNERVLVQENSFKKSAFPNAKNIFGQPDGDENLIIRNNEFPIIIAHPTLGNRVDFNISFSSEHYYLFENDAIVEIADDDVFIFPSPSSNFFIELGSNATDVGAFYYKTGSTLTSIYSATQVNQTTGALTGTTGLDNKLNFSAVGDTIYVENRLGASQFIRVKIKS